MSARHGARAHAGARLSHGRAPVRFLRDRPGLAGADDEALADLGRLLVRREVSRRDEVWRAGEAADHVALVRSGVARLSVPTHGGRPVTAGFVPRGRWIGLEALADDGERGTTCTAWEDLTLLVGDREAVVRWIAKHPRSGAGLIGAAAAQTVAAHRRLAVQGRRHAKTRLALALGELARDFGVRDSRGVILDLRLTHRELAALIGATRETVSVAIEALRQDRVIRTEHRRVVIVDEAALDGLVCAA